MESFDEIFVYVGPRAQGEFAVARAARLASGSGARVTFAMRQSDDRISCDPGILAASRLPPTIERLVEPLADCGVDVVVRVLPGRRMSALFRAVREARPDLVIKAADLDDMRLAIWRRTSAEKLTAECDAPVWVVRLAPPQGPSTIVAALGTGLHDDPVHDARVLATARRVAHGLDTPLRIVSHGLVLSEDGPARRMGRSGDVHEDTLRAVSAIGADLVVISADVETSVLGRSAVRGIMRRHHASVMVVPRAAPLPRASRPDALPVVADTVPGAAETPTGV